MKILITGFEPFLNNKVNPSMDVANALLKRNRVVLILPVEYEKAKELLLETIKREKPDYILSLGLHDQSSTIRIERTAYNEMDSASPDNAGVIKRGEPVIEGGLEKISTLVYTALLSGLIRLRNVPCVESLNPGRYLCNMVYYLDLNSSATTSLFIHLPPYSAMDKEDMIKACEATIELLINGRHNINNI